MCDLFGLIYQKRFTFSAKFLWRGTGSHIHVLSLRLHHGMWPRITINRLIVKSRSHTVKRLHLINGASYEIRYSLSGCLLGHFTPRRYPQAWRTCTCRVRSPNDGNKLGSSQLSPLSTLPVLRVLFRCNLFDVSSVFGLFFQANLILIIILIDPV